MIRLSFLFILLSLPAITHSVPTVHSELGSTWIKIGEQTSLTLRVEGSPSDAVEFPRYDSLSVLTPGISVISSHDSTFMSGGSPCYQRRYLITSFDTAHYDIPSLDVKVSGQAYSTNSIPLEVRGVDIDTTKVDKIFGLKSPMEPAFDMNEWRLPLLLGILTFIVSLLLTYIIIRIKDNKPIIRRIRFSPYIPPHKTALTEIDKIRDDDLLSSGDPKDYYTRLTDVLRKYMEQRYGFNAMEMTTDEIIHELESLDDYTSLSELNSLFTTADLVKFAKANPEISEKDKNLLNAVAYIQSTKKEELAEVAPKEIVVEDVHSKQTKRFLYIGITIASIALLIIVIYLIQYILVLKY